MGAACVPHTYTHHSLDRHYQSSLYYANATPPLLAVSCVCVDLCLRLCLVSKRGKPRAIAISFRSDSQQFAAAERSALSLPSNHHQPHSRRVVRSPHNTQPRKRNTSTFHSVDRRSRELPKRETQRARRALCLARSLPLVVIGFGIS